MDVYPFEFCFDVRSSPSAAAGPRFKCRKCQMSFPPPRDGTNLLQPTQCEAKCPVALWCKKLYQQLSGVESRESGMHRHRYWGQWRRRGWTCRKHSYSEWGPYAALWTCPGVCLHACALACKTGAGLQYIRAIPSRSWQRKISARDEDPFETLVGECNAEVGCEEEREVKALVVDDAVAFILLPEITTKMLKDWSEQGDLTIWSLR